MSRLSRGLMSNLSEFPRRCKLPGFVAPDPPREQTVAVSVSSIFRPGRIATVFLLNDGISLPVWARGVNDPCDKRIVLI